MTDSDTGRVECYSGHTYAQEPRALVWRAQRYAIVQIERRWQSPEGPAFCVGTETGERFELHYHERAQQWMIVPLVASNDTPEQAVSTARPQMRTAGSTRFDDHHNDTEVRF